MVGYGGVVKRKIAEFSLLQSQINRNILDFLFYSLVNFQQQLDFNPCGNTNEGCDGYNNY
jgi:hypothetical protein